MHWRQWTQATASELSVDYRPIRRSIDKAPIRPWLSPKTLTIPIGSHSWSLDLRPAIASGTVITVSG
jgi:hypothetical protein